MPKHYWAERDPSITSIEPPLGSGPYRVKDFRVGRWVEYERVENYWGRKLPVNLGRYNFDVLKYDYFRDDQVRHEAVKSHVSDLREEEVPSRWFRSYNVPAKKTGLFKQQAMKVSTPSGLWWPIFWNLRQERFRDVRIREALWLVRDPLWANEAVQRGFWSLATSYFHNSRMATIPGSGRGLCTYDAASDTGVILVTKEVTAEPFQIEFVLRSTGVPP